MGYTDDWESLMNGVFGPGGKLRFDTQKTSPEKPGLPDMNAALLEQPAARVFRSILDAKFNKDAVALANPAKDFRDERIFRCLAVDLRGCSNQVVRRAAILEMTPSTVP